MMAMDQTSKKFASNSAKSELKQFELNRPNQTDRTETNRPNQTGRVLKFNSLKSAGFFMTRKWTSDDFQAILASEPEVLAHSTD